MNQPNRLGKIAVPPALTVRHYNPPGVSETLQTTVRLIGQGIETGAAYLPIRDYAARVATTAGPKDYLGQARAIYEDFTKKWRYVHDPLGIETVVTSGPAIYALVLGRRPDAKPGQKGYGDCDDCTVALGAMYRSIGLPVRIVTMIGPKRGGRRGEKGPLFTHVFLQVKIKKKGWITTDPVLFPKGKFGQTAKNVRYAVWNTKGKFLSAGGRYPGPYKTLLKGMALGAVDDESEVSEMESHTFKDFGLERAFGRIPEASEQGVGDLADFSLEGPVDQFGAYSDEMGVIQGHQIPGVLMEYDDDDVMQVQGLGEVVRTKMLEMDPSEYQYVAKTGSPRAGATAISDDGDVYQYHPQFQGELGGFFKKLFKKIGKKVRKAVKWVAKKVKKGVRWLVKKLPGGKWLLKMFDKLKKIAMKLVKPLMKFVGKYAKKLAPIAAMIPGYGPAIAAGLHVAGRIAKVVNKLGVKFEKKTHRPKFKSDKHAKKFRRSLKKEAERMKRKKGGMRRTGRRGRGRGRFARAGGRGGRRRRFPRRGRWGGRMGARRRRGMMKSPAFRRLRGRMKRRGRRMGRPRRHFMAGTPEHAEVLRGLGLALFEDVEDMGGLGDFDDTYDPSGGY